MWCLQTIVAQNEKAHESGKHTPATKRIVSVVPAKHSPKCKRAQERYDPDCPRCKGRFGAKRA
jgi:hypothetical protein